MPITPQSINFFFNFGSAVKADVLQAGGTDNAELGRGTFRVFQGANLDQHCAWIRSEGVLSDEYWVWIDSLVAGANGVASRKYAAPGAPAGDVSLRFVKYAFFPASPTKLPTPTEWIAAVTTEANPTVGSPDYVLQGVFLDATPFAP